MVRTYGPLFSLDASGTLGKAITFSKWKGRSYVRERVIPSNPKSGGQVGMRAMLKFLSQSWSAVIAGSQATWETRASAKSVAPFNSYVGYNASRWRNFTAPTSHDPEAATDTPATVGATSLILGERSITASIPITTAADGWGVLIFRALAGGFTTGWDNLIAVSTISGTDTLLYVDTPLTPDTYYYNFREFTLDGQLGAEDGELNDTVV